MVSVVLHYMVVEVERGMGIYSSLSVREGLLEGVVFKLGGKRGTELSQKSRFRGR